MGTRRAGRAGGELMRAVMTSLGDSFGMLTVVDVAGPLDIPHRQVWLCKCQCGRSTKATGKALHRNNNPRRHCGCVPKRHRPPIDETGKIYGRITVLGRDGSDLPVKWLYRCDCGSTGSTRGECLRRGQRSCGCTKSHGRSREPEYVAWCSMRARCGNPNNGSFADYGGRGIRVCERWHEYTSFIADMGRRPVGMSLDRIDPNGNYELANCRWATPKVQCSNKRLSDARVRSILDEAEREGHNVAWVRARLFGGAV